MKKKLFLALVIILVAIQFIPMQLNQGLHSKNESNLPEFFDKYPISNTVKNILRTSCFDCHSNATVYPGYSKIQPVGFWLNHHVEEGKEHLNFDEMHNYPDQRLYHKLEEIREQVDEGEMPLSSYTLIHTDAKLDELQKQEVKLWAKGVMDSMVRAGFKKKPRKHRD